METDRITRLTAAIQDVTGTDEGTAEWLAVGVFSVLAVMRLESQSKPVPATDAVSAAYRRAGEIVDAPGSDRAAFEAGLPGDRPFEPGEVIEYVCRRFGHVDDGQWVPGIFRQYPAGESASRYVITETLGRPRRQQQTLLPEVRHIDPALISAARSWAVDCQWTEDADDIADLPDLQVVAGVQRHYAGGWTQFVRDRS